MDSYRLLLLISFLIMCQSNEAAVVGTPVSTSTSGNNCSIFASTSLDLINVDIFRSNVKQEFKRFNCSYPGFVKLIEADLENPKKDLFGISSANFCTSINITSWEKFDPTLFPNLNHLEMKIFTNQTLCIVVCTKDLNEILWPYCGAVRNLLEKPAEKVPSKVGTQPLKPGAVNNITNQSTKLNSNPKNNLANSSVSSKNSTSELVNQSNSMINPMKDSANPSNLVDNLKNSAANPAHSFENQNDNPVDLDLKNNQRTNLDGLALPNLKPNQDDVKNNDINLEVPEGVSVERQPINTGSKAQNMPDSSKETEQQGLVNPSNRFEKEPVLPVDVPSKSLPRTAIVAGTSNLRPENDESHYFIYFVVMSMLCIFCYIGIYNKKKILALMIEGRKQKDRRRHASAGYRKLNTNLEEVMPLGNPAPATDSMIY